MMKEKLLELSSQYEEEPGKLNEDDFFYYFLGNYNIKDISTTDYRTGKKIANYETEFYLTVNGSQDKLVSYSTDCNGNEESHCIFCGGNKCRHIKALINHNFKIFKNDLTDELEEKERLYIESQKEEQQGAFLALFNSQVKDKIDREDILSTQEEVKLEPVIDTNTKELSFRLGRKKMYIVKSISGFLYSIKNNNEIRYGKELNFIHDIKIFDEKGQKLIKYMLNNTDFSDSERSVRYDDKLLDFIFGLYQGSTINIDTYDYRIALEIPNISIFINYDYTLQVRGLSHYEVMGNSDKYLVDRENRQIDMISEDEVFAQLVCGILKYPLASIKPFFEDFKFNAYLKYQKYFVIHDSLIDAFAFDDIDINAYFDYDPVNDRVTLVTKLVKDHLEVTPDTLNKVMAYKYHKYLKLIAAYGFEENILDDESDILNFLRSDLSSLKEVCNVFLSDGLQNKKLITFKCPSLTVNYQNNMTDVFFQNSEFDETDLRNIIKAIRRKRKYVLLSGDRIVSIDDEEAGNFADIIDDFNLDDNHLLEDKKAPVYQALKVYNHKEIANIDAYLEKMLDDIANFKTAGYELPSVNATLRDYQKDAYQWLRVLCSYNLSGILADDMGLGKTLEIITLIASLPEEKPYLIVCPKSLIFNWISEINKFAPGLKTVPVYGNVSNRKQIIAGIKETEKTVYLTSYDTLRGDIDLYDNITFNMIILDEAQFIKNVYAQKTKVVKKLKANYRFALTGTPIENNVLDLWSIFDFLMPGYLTTISDFKSKYEHDENYTNIIYKKVAPFILRRTKHEVLTDLPDKYEVVMTCEMTTEQRMIYDAQALVAKDLIEMGGNKISLLAHFTILREVCVDPSMYVENYNGTSGKMNTLMDLINERISDGHRILVFSQFVKCLEIIATKLHKKGIPFFMITGDTESIERVNICNEFNANDDYKIVLISLKAGGTGLNLTGADVVIHVDPWWNISATNQATDRAHRIGQSKNVEVIKLICEDSIEQKVIELQNKKKEVIDALISNDDSSITNLSKEDMKFLVE